MEFEKLDEPCSIDTPRSPSPNDTLITLVKNTTNNVRVKKEDSFMENNHLNEEGLLSLLQNASFVPANQENEDELYGEVWIFCCELQLEKCQFRIFGYLVCYYTCKFIIFMVE